MDFDRRKLSIQEASKLRKVLIQSVKPYALMFAPVYVFLKRNGKFVSVKAPLDFFSPEELKRLSSLGAFFLPEFIDSTLPFHDAGKRVRAILSASPAKLPSAQGLPAVAIPPTPYELSDAILRIIGPLWANTGTLEPFFIAAFVNAMLPPLPSKELYEAREGDLEAYEYGVLLSSWVVFLALHLGQLEFKYLERIRNQVFSFASLNRPLGTDVDAELPELVDVSGQALEHSKTRVLLADYFEERTERVSRKLASRLRRVCAEMISQAPEPATILGEEGFVSG